jgi:hypothetical protein
VRNLSLDERRRAPRFNGCTRLLAGNPSVRLVRCPLHRHRFGSEERDGTKQDDYDHGSDNSLHGVDLENGK